MAPYTYNNFYDPVGSQSNQQPSGYTYQGNSASSNAQYPAPNTSYQSNYNSNYGTAYSNQQYGGNAQQSQSQQPQPQPQQQAASASAAASGLQDYGQPASASSRSSNVASGYDNSGWTAQNYASSAYNTMTNRSQANQSPLYATQGSSATFGQLSIPNQSQTSSNTFANTQQSYQAPAPTSTSNSSSSSRTYRNAPNSAGYKNTYQPQPTQQQPPQRYASPLQAMQAQQQQTSHNKQPSRSSNHAGPSPQMTGRNLQQQQRQQSASVEPSPTTVDPSQVYDFRAEQEKRARIEAEKRRKIEAERAARQAEEDARKAEEDARKAEEERVAAEAKKTEDDAQKAREAEAKKEAAKQRRAEARKKAREEKRQSNTAATALQQMASSSAAPAGSAAAMMNAMMGNMSGPPANNEEAEMRAMFKKMREFNQKNPAMLAKLWEEERQQHAAQTSPPAAQAAATATPAPAAAPAPVQAPASTKAAKGKKKAPPPAALHPPAPAQPAVQQSAAPSSGKTPLQASPTKGQSGSLWPPHKKGSLAEAAAKWLSALPDNAGKSISKEEIIAILDNNPSYVQLCEAIEKMGIRFERSTLAKELLKAVPDGLKGQQAPKPATPATNVTAQLNGAASTPGSAPPKKRGRPKKDEPGRYSLPSGAGSRGSGTVSYSTPSFSSLADAAREVNAMDAPYYPSAASESLVSTLASGPPQAGYGNFDDTPIIIDDSNNAHTPDVKPEEKPESPPRPPADKEEAARKRGFGDLVDLTAADSDDEDGPPPKFFKPMPPPPPTNGMLPSTDFRKPIPYNQFMQQRQTLNPGQGGMHPSAPPRPVYNPQQWSLQKPQSPATPPVPVKSNGPTEEQKQSERLRGKMLVEPIMRDRVARKSRYDSRTIARDVLLATGRHPDMRALNAHMNPVQRLLGDHGGVVDGAGNKSDLSTIRWDIIDPGEPTEEATARAKSASGGRDKGDADESDAPTSKPVSKKREETDVDSDAPRELQAGKPRAKANKIGKRGPGRPPKAGRSGSPPAPALRVASADLLDSNSNEHPELTSDLPHRASPAHQRSTSAQSGASPGMAIGYSAFRQYDENGNPIKKKGRPVGWRKSIHSREAQGLTPKKSGEYIPKGPGRPRQSATKDDLVQPKYQIFRCEWQDCSGELDNLEKLRKHVIKIHGSPNSEGDHECRWKSCRSQGLHIDARGKARSGEVGVSSFENIEYWTKHINKAHVEAVAWKQGDGPKGGTVSEQHTDSDTYLSDAYGRSVTPVIVPRSEQQVSEGSTTPKSPAAAAPMGPPAKPGPSRPPKHREASGLASANSSVEVQRAAAELKKLEDQKRHEGFTMGLQGCRLINEKRRKGFLDDEDFEDYVYDTEPEY